MKHYSVIIVGAGPAGSTCAYNLARQGIDVLLLDKSKMPRLKPCGGGFPEKTRLLYDFDLSSVLEVTVKAAAISLLSEKHILIQRPEGMGYMVMRDKFDSLLVQHASNAGVDLHQGEKFKNLKRNNGRWVLKTDKGEYSADFIVGADGAPSRVAKQLGLMRNFDRNAMAIAAELYVSDKQLERQGPTANFDFHRVRKGYAWIFPKSDHLSIGVYSTLPKVKGLMKALNEYIEQEENLRGYKEMTYCRGGLIPRGGVYNKITTEGALLAGDASAMTDPFFGEGIYYAAKSGIMAAQAILKAISSGDRSLDDYDMDIKVQLVQDFWWARFFNFTFYRFPNISYPIVHRYPHLQNLALDVNAGKMSWRECVLRTIFFSPYWAIFS